MKNKTGFRAWARQTLFAGGCLAATVATGDTAFTAGEWEVAFAAEGAK